MIASLFRPSPARRAGRALCVEVARAGREPALFGAGRAPDTFEGRFEVVTLTASVVLRRLAGRGRLAEAVGQALFDDLFRSFDQALRDVGVGDLSVGKRIRKMAEAFYGRAQAYRSALDAGDLDALAAALERNWRAGAPAEPGFFPRLAAHVAGLAAVLDAVPDAQLLDGAVSLPAFEPGA